MRPQNLPEQSQWWKPYQCFTRSDSTLLPAHVIYSLKETLTTKVQCSLSELCYPAWKGTSRCFLSLYWPLSALPFLGVLLSDQFACACHFHPVDFLLSLARLPQIHLLPDCWGHQQDSHLPWLPSVIWEVDVKCVFLSRGPFNLEAALECAMLEPAPHHWNQLGSLCRHQGSPDQHRGVRSWKRVVWVQTTAGWIHICSTPDWTRWLVLQTAELLLFTDSLRTDNAWYVQVK